MNQNRTIVECKFDNPDIVHSVFLIRIEPQWNVNIENYSMTEKGKKIRIEPQWNVNIENYSMTEKGKKNQNRTIVECKYGRIRNNRVILKHQNRTIVECKFVLFSFHSLTSSIRIEPQWNVNAVCSSDIQRFQHQNRTIVECKY